MSRQTVLEFYALSEAIPEAGVDSFTVRRMLDRIERSELSVAQATELLENGLLSGSQSDDLG